jgi:hypothetical protein
MHLERIDHLVKTQTQRATKIVWVLSPSPDTINLNYINHAWIYLWTRHPGGRVASGPNKHRPFPYS